MMNPLDMNRQHQSRKPNVVLPLAIGCAAFVIGVGATLGVMQWQSQQRQLAEMTQTLIELQQARNTPVQPSQAAPVDEVTRNAPVDLLSLAPAPTPDAPEPRPIAAAATAPADPVDDVGRTTADRIRALVARSSDPMVSAAIAQDVARRETMSIAIQGVNELVQAALAGDYALKTINDESGKKELRISFAGHADDQRALENLLSSAAGAGMIAYNESVRSNDGTFDGRIILYDLVERALLNGTAEERALGEEIQSRALALLSTGNAVAQQATREAGKTFYTVEAGDSLAYIALQFYGNTNGYLKIYQANRDQISSPERIRIGQRLYIPEV